MNLILGVGVSIALVALSIKIIPLLINLLTHTETDYSKNFLEFSKWYNEHDGESFVGDAYAYWKQYIKQ